MSSRSAREAVSRHKRAVQLCVGCITTAAVTSRGDDLIRGQASSDTQSISLQNGRFVPLRGALPLLIRIVQRIAIRQETDDPTKSGVSIVGYIYTLMLPVRVEVVAYHWHPGEELVSDPHLHIGPAALGRDAAVLPGLFHKVHFPTGYVSLEDFIRLAITEFGVEPRRADWAAVLTETRAAVTDVTA